MKALLNRHEVNVVAEVARADNGEREKAIAYAEVSLKTHAQIEDPFVETVHSQLAE